MGLIHGGPPGYSGHACSGHSNVAMGVSRDHFKQAKATVADYYFFAEN